MSKAKLVKIPERWIVEIGGQIVDFGRSGYQAAEMAKAHGATETEVVTWQKYFPRSKVRGSTQASS